MERNGSKGIHSSSFLAPDKKRPGVVQHHPALNLRVYTARLSGGGGIRTHGAHRTRDFQSRPLGHYGTPPEPYHSQEAGNGTGTSRACYPHWPGHRAERVGFEPTRLSPTAFRERHHQPLGHLSLSFLVSIT